MWARLGWLGLLGVMGVVLGPQALAINRCVGPGGQVVFQDRACEGAGQRLDVRPATSNTPPAPAAAPSVEGGAAVRPGSVIEQQVHKAQEERIRREKWFEMRDAGQVLDRQFALCDQEQRALANEKNLSRNNLAGATRDVSIATQMQAAATVCAEKVKRAQAQLDAARDTCERIRCLPTY